MKYYVKFYIYGEHDDYYQIWICDEKEFELVHECKIEISVENSGESQRDDGGDYEIEYISHIAVDDNEVNSFFNTPNYFKEKMLKKLERGLNESRPLAPNFHPAKTPPYTYKYRCEHIDCDYGSKNKCGYCKYRFCNKCKNKKCDFCAEYEYQQVYCPKCVKLCKVFDKNMCDSCYDDTNSLRDKYYCTDCDDFVSDDDIHKIKNNRDFCECDCDCIDIDAGGDVCCNCLDDMCIKCTACNCTCDGELTNTHNIMMYEDYRGEFAKN